VKKKSIDTPKNYSAKVASFFLKKTFATKRIFHRMTPLYGSTEKSAKSSLENSRFPLQISTTQMDFLCDILVKKQPIEFLTLRSSFPNAVRIGIVNKIFAQELPWKRF
jgi:hypothetical protein